MGHGGQIVFTKEVYAKIEEAIKAEDKRLDGVVREIAIANNFAGRGGTK